jgi:hypothetical protein
MFVVFIFHAARLTQFVENTCNICIPKYSTTLLYYNYSVMQLDALFLIEFHSYSVANELNREMFTAAGNLTHPLRYRSGRIRLPAVVNGAPGLFDHVLRVVHLHPEGLPNLNTAAADL